VLVVFTMRADARGDIETVPSRGACIGVRKVNSARALTRPLLPVSGYRVAVAR
jgi:hypothetical protein